MRRLRAAVRFGGTGAATGRQRHRRRLHGSTHAALLDLISRLEDAAGRPIDLVDLTCAGPSIAFRAFRDGQVLLCRDRRAFVDRKARAISEYLDWRPMEERFIAGVLGNGRGR